MIRHLDLGPRKISYRSSQHKNCEKQVGTGKIQIKINSTNYVP